MIEIKNATFRDLPGILKLQELNLKKSLGSTEIVQEGFVTLQHSLDILVKMNTPYPHTIAVFEDEVIGYALSMLVENSYLVPEGIEMFNCISSMENFVVMGQVCVGIKHRKKGIFRSMYNHMQSKFCGIFEYIITEIDVLNERSIKAHKSIGFQEIATRPGWSIVALEIPEFIS